MCRTTAHGKAPQDSAWTRVVAVDMQGPRFLALTATDSYDCGSLYPNDGIQMPLVYDLLSGRPVNWLTYFPKGAIATLETSADGAKVGLVVWSELTRRANAAASKECKDAFGDDETVGRAFGITLNGKSGTLVARPADLPHALQACGEDVALPAGELRRLGFAPELVSALEAAQAH